MAHSSTQYQRVYMKIRQSLPEQRETLRTALHEVLKLHFELEALEAEYQLRSQTGKPIKVNPEFKLQEYDLKAIHTAVSAEPKGVPQSRTETVQVDIPRENTLDTLIPFYQDIAVEFYARYNTLKLEQIENAVKRFQGLNISELETLKQTLVELKETVFYQRIMQECFAALNIIDESLGLKESWANLKQYGDTVDNQKKLWLLCMKKLFSEGYSYFEANLASNRVVERAILMVNPVSEGFLTDNPLSTPHNEMTSLYAVETNDPAFEAWKITESRVNVTMKELLYVKFRNVEIEEQAEYNRWRKEVKEWLISEIENGGWSESIRRDCIIAGYSQLKIKEVLDMYQKLIAEGYMLKLPVKVKETESNSTIVRASDSDQGNKEDKKQ